MKKIINIVGIMLFFVIFSITGKIILASDNIIEKLYFTNLKVVKSRPGYRSGERFQNGQKIAYKFASYTIDVTGELFYPVSDVRNGIIEKIITDTGLDVTPQEDSDRKISFPKLSSDGKNVEFTIKIFRPEQEAKINSFKEILGNIKLIEGIGEKEEDLGISQFKKLAKGKKYAAIIDNIVTHESGEKTLDLQLQIPPYIFVKTIELYDANGNKLDVSGDMKPFFSDSITYITIQFTSLKGFPDKGRIVLKIYENFAEHNIPFELKDVAVWVDSQ